MNLRFLAVLVLAGGCTTAASPPAPAPTPAAAPAPPTAAAPATRTLPLELHWLRNSAEYRAVALGTYRAATERVTELSRGLAPGSWAVVLDVDETSLDNSEYERRRALSGATHVDDAWYAWIREEKATAVPGAVEFTQAVRRLGGRVALVTNRDDIVCDATRDNVRSVGLAADAVLCRVNRVSDKVPRFTAVETGAAGFAPARILVWLGDNITDFPGLTQAARTTPGGLDLFGSRYFMIPNPVYGSWVNNPQN